MAQCVQSVQELIPDSFVPCVAALCSDEAERLTRLNHLSFAELLKPFSRLTSEGTWGSSSSISYSRAVAEKRKLGARRGQRGGGPGLRRTRGRPASVKTARSWPPRFSKALSSLDEPGH